MVRCLGIIILPVTNVMRVSTYLGKALALGEAPVHFIRRDTLRRDMAVSNTAMDQLNRTSLMDKMVEAYV